MNTKVKKPQTKTKMDADRMKALEQHLAAVVRNAKWPDCPITVGVITEDYFVVIRGYKYISYAFKWGARQLECNNYVVGYIRILRPDEPTNEHIWNTDGEWIALKGF